MNSYFSSHPSSKIDTIKWIDLQQNCVLALTLEFSQICQVLELNVKNLPKFKPEAQWYWDQSEDSPKKSGWDWVPYPEDQNYQIELAYVKMKESAPLGSKCFFEIRLFFLTFFFYF